MWFFFIVICVDFNIFLSLFVFQFYFRSFYFILFLIQFGHYFFINIFLYHFLDLFFYFIFLILSFNILFHLIFLSNLDFYFLKKILNLFYFSI
jgi:hypothetical protein